MARGGKRPGAGRPSSAPHEAPAGQRWCPFGKHFVDISDFHRGYCKACMYQYRKTISSPKHAHQNLRKRLVKALGGRCAVCRTDDLEVLQLDHLDKTSGYILRRILGWKTSRVYRFALKYPEHYQLLCRNCHWNKHRTRVKYENLSDKEINKLWRE